MVIIHWEGNWHPRRGVDHGGPMRMDSDVNPRGEYLEGMPIERLSRLNPFRAQSEGHC
jgi:hypothetical protein